MNSTAKTALIVSGVAFAAYFLFRKPTEQMPSDEQDKGTEKKKLPNIGGGGGGGGTSSGGVSPIPVAPTLAVPTSQIIVQTQPTSSTSTPTTPTTSGGTTTPTSPSGGSSTANNPIASPTGTGSTGSSGSTSNPPIASPTGTGTSSPTSNTPIASPTAATFSEFSYVDGGQDAMLDALL